MVETTSNPFGRFNKVLKLLLREFLIYKIPIKVNRNNSRTLSLVLLTQHLSCFSDQFIYTSNNYKNIDPNVKSISKVQEGIISI